MPNPFIIFIDYSNLKSAFARVFGCRITTDTFKSLVDSIVKFCHRRGLTRPIGSAGPRSYIYIYVATEPRELVAPEVRSLVKEVEDGTIEGAIIRGGRLSITTERCGRRSKEDPSRECDRQVECVEEKEVEVSLATDLVRFACRNDFQTAILMSADRDFIPVVEVVQRGEKKQIINIFPRLDRHSILAERCSEFVDLRELRAPSLRKPEIPPQIIQRLCGYQRPDGHSLNSGDFQTWLRQFGSDRRQELAEILISNIDFYNRRRITSQLSFLIDKFIRPAFRSEEIGVSLLGNPADSSAVVSYLSRDEFARHGFHIEDLQSLRRNPKVKTVVFLDDNLGSGKQAHEIFLQWFGNEVKVLEEQHVTELPNEMKAWLQDKSVSILTCMAYRKGVERLRKGLPVLKLTLGHCEGFVQNDELSGCFHPGRGLFNSDRDREEAKKMVAARRLMDADNSGSMCAKVNM